MASAPATYVLRTFYSKPGFWPCGALIGSFGKPRFSSTNLRAAAEDTVPIRRNKKRSTCLVGAAAALCSSRTYKNIGTHR